MVTYKYNKPYYELHFSNYDESTAHVLSFEGEERISDLFEFRIDFVSEDPELDSSVILNNNAAFILNRGDEEPIKIYGIISNLEQYGRTPDYVFYKAVLVPRIWRLGLVFQNEVYLSADIETLIEKVMEDVGLTGQDYKIDLKNKYPEKEYVVQYRETDLDFIQRRLEHYGIFYYFDHKDGKDVVVFTDTNNKIPSINLGENIGYNINKDPLSEKESVMEISCKEKIVTGSFQVKDYNYMFPEKQLMAQSQINSNHPGLYYDFGDNFEDEKEAELIAKVRNQEFLCESRIFYGISDCRMFSAGYKFTLEKHYRKDWDGEYIIKSVTHRGNQQSLFALLPSTRARTTYENKFEAIPASIDFRPARKTRIPKIYGIMSAKIESGSGDEYAYIDDQGRYKAKMLFDLTDTSNGESSLPIRLTQSYSGSGYGIHFPNHANNELLWACVDGNVDRPVGLGTIPNPSQATPVNQKNKSQNIIRTAAGNEILIDDKSKESQISLITTDGNKILLDDKDDKIYITTKDKHWIEMDDKRKKIEIRSKGGCRIIMNDKDENMMIYSKRIHGILIKDKDGDESLQISDRKLLNGFSIDITENQVYLYSYKGNIDILAPEGELNIKAKTLNIETEGDTTIKSGNFKTEVNEDFELKAANIKQEAQANLKQKAGANVESEAGADHKINGLNVTVEAGIESKLKGSLATVEATGINTIKGSLVKIN
jgi:type VI secretion system secreted protein VgrG